MVSVTYGAIILAFGLAEDIEDLIVGFGAEQPYAGLPEVRQPLEEGRGGQMPPYVQYPPVLIDTLYRLADLTAQQLEFLMHRHRRQCAGLEILRHIAKYPGRTE